MAGKKKEKGEEINIDMSNGLGNDFFSDLIKDTDFKIAETGSLQNDGIKVYTPLYVLNCIWGGGMPLDMMVEVSGEPGSGKTTFLHQCIANYQRQYKNGIPIVLDLEGSMDTSRLHALGVDTEKLLRLPATSMENAFANIFTMLNKLEKMYEQNKDISVMFIYDSLAAGGTEAQAEATAKGESAFGAGAMMSAPRILKQNLSNILPYMEKLPVGLYLINQVQTTLNSYGMASVKSAGGFGLKHFCSAHLMFSRPKDTISKEGFLLGSNSALSLKKCRMSPKVENIPVYIDATNGGRIDEIRSFYEYLVNMGLIKTGSWYKFGDYVREMIDRYPILADSEINELLDRNIRKDDMLQMFYDSPNLVRFFEVCVIEFIDGIFPAQREINSEYEAQLMSECEYFKGNTKIVESRTDISSEGAIEIDHSI